MRFTFSVNSVIQGLAFSGHMLNGALPFFSPKVKMIASGVLSIIQALSAFLAHYNNPDGTPAAVAYVSKQE